MVIRTKKWLRTVCKIFLAIVASALLGWGGFYIYRAIKFNPQNVVITNITDSSVTVTWTTDSPMKGIVYYKKNTSPLAGPFGIISSQKGNDDRDISDAQKTCADAFNKKANETKNSNFSVSGDNYDCLKVTVTKRKSYYTHSVTITNLDESSTYYFVVGNGLWSFKVGNSNVKTFATLNSVGEPEPLFGKVLSDDGSYSRDGLVYLQLSSTKDQKESIVYSSVTSDDGGWYIDAQEARDVDGHVLNLELTNDSFTTKAVYSNYGTSEEQRFILGGFNVVYPDIVVEKKTLVSGLVNNLIQKAYATCGYEDGVFKGDTCAADVKSGKVDIAEVGYGNVIKAITASNNGNVSQTLADLGLGSVGSSVANYNANAVYGTSLDGTATNITATKNTNGTVTVTANTINKNKESVTVSQQCASNGTSCNSQAVTTCGNEICESGENSNNCSSDCHVADGSCSSYPSNCAKDGKYGVCGSNYVCNTSCSVNGISGYYDEDRKCVTNEITCDGKPIDECEDTGRGTSKLCLSSGEWQVFNDSNTCGKVITCDDKPVSTCEDTGNGTSRLCLSSGSWKTFSNSSSCDNTNGIVTDSQTGTVTCNQDSSYNTSCVLDLDGNKYTINGFSNKWGVNAQNYDTAYLVAISQIDLVKLASIDQNVAKNLVSENAAVKVIALDQLSILEKKLQDSTPGTTPRTEDAVSSLCTILEGTVVTTNAGVVQSCSLPSSSSLEFLNPSKVFADNNSSPSSYALYLPQYGMYDFLLGNYTMSTETSSGSTMYIFYIETNGIKGFQMPADPANPTSDEDVVLNTNAYQINYSQKTTAQQYDIKKGINIISFDFIATNADSKAYTASDVITQAAKNNVNIQYITTFNGGRWSSGYSCSNETCTGANFTIVPGVGYLIYSTDDGTITIPGYNLSTPIPIAFSAGWNLVGVHGYTTAYTARTFLDSINGIEGLTADNVTWWPTSKGKYEGISLVNGTQYGTDFALSSTMGYFVRISKFVPTDTSCKSLIWNPGGSLNGTCGNTK